MQDAAKVVTELGSSQKSLPLIESSKHTNLHAIPSNEKAGLLSFLSSVSDKFRERSHSASEHQGKSATKLYNTFLSPSVVTQPSYTRNLQTRKESFSALFTGQKNRPRSASTFQESPSKASPSMASRRSLITVSNGSGVKRSSSTTLVQRPKTKSQCGSEHQLGLSVTFCDTKCNEPGLMLLYKNEVSLRRSHSETLSYPNENASNHRHGSLSTHDTRLSLQRSAYDCSAGHPCRLMLPTPSITYGGTSTMPSTPTWGNHDSKMANSRRFGSSCHLQVHNKAVMVTPRGSFLAVNQSPLEFRESTLSICYPNCGDDGEEVSLVYARLEKIPMKDFAAEIRAHLDVEHFLSQAQLMLDVQETNMEEIMDCMLHHLLDEEEAPATFLEAKKVLFTHDSAHQLSKTIQCTCSTYGGGYDYDQSWVCVLCTLSSVQKRHVAIARLRSPANLGRTSQDVWFIILVVTSNKEKGTKNALETGRTFATLFADMDLRLRLLGAHSEEEFKKLLWEHMKELAEEQCDGSSRRKQSEDSVDKDTDTAALSVARNKYCFAQGLREDWKRRIPHYLSDYTDGLCGANTLHKTVSTTFFLYFACILPAIALGVLYYNNTSGSTGKGQIDVKKVIYSQTIGGLVFAIFGGQPMVILLTTAPLALYTKVIYNICEDWKLDFVGMFACTGLWNSFFLLIYAFTDASKLMKWCTRSTEEIFALFISMAFAVDAFKDVVYDFQENYHSPKCDLNDTKSFIPSADTVRTPSPQDIISHLALKADQASGSGKGYGGDPVVSDCLRENSLLYLLLMLGTVWLGLSLYNFTKTPFLNASKRELLADCALPVSVLLMSFFGSYIFKDVKLKKFELIRDEIFKPAPLSKLEWPAIFGAMGLGFCLSLLFFMDQNIAGAMVNSPDNRMKKGPAYHWDLMVIALLNAFLSFFGLPMVHGALPHSPLHVRAMADVEDRVYQGHVYLKIVCVRETRVTGIFSHILIGLSLLFIDDLKKIPRPVLDGLFLYLAITALHSNQLFERIMLLVTEQAAYPPNHYIRTVPQRKIHLFTFLQLLQLAVLCGFGFAPMPYLKIVFPVLHLVMLPVRHKLVPYLIEKKYLQSLDGH